MGGWGRGSIKNHKTIYTPGVKKKVFLSFLYIHIYFPVNSLLLSFLTIPVNILGVWSDWKAATGQEGSGNGEN